jgi:phosphoribosylamine--glycine ligase
VTPRWQAGAAVTVVMAAPGYPDEYESGVEITRIDQAEARGCLVFHAGTKWKDTRLLTAGGRVLAVTATGGTLADARTRAYGGVGRIHFNNAHYRRDIGQKQR